MLLRERTTLPSITVCGLRIDNVTMDEAITEILARTEPTRLCFLNADCVNISYRDADYRRLVQTADLVFADGSGLRMAGKMYKTPVRDNVNGTDLFPRLMQALEGTGKRVFLLGGREGVPEAVRDRIAREWPGVDVCGARNGYFPRSDSNRVAAEIRAADTDILFVAFGAPHQEKWIAEWLAESGATVALGVGGLFDFFSGRMPRAPRWMRALGIEWLFRFWQEPGRMWKRYWVGNFVFLYRVWRDRRRT